MRRIHFVLSAMLLGLGIGFVLSSSQANEDGNHDLIGRTEGASSQIELIERIEALEKRIAKIEAERSLVRQADSRETAPYEPQFSPSPLPQALTQPAPAGESRNGAVKEQGAGIYMHYIIRSDDNGQPAKVIRR